MHLSQGWREVGLELDRSIDWIAGRAGGGFLELGEPTLSISLHF